MKEMRENRPPWRSTGAGQAMPNWDRPSKYQRDANVRAKINTGLGAGSQQNQQNGQGMKQGDEKKSSANQETRDENKEKKPGDQQPLSPTHAAEQHVL